MPSDSGGFVSGLNSVITTVGETFKNVFTAVNPPKTGAGVTPAPAPTSTPSKSSGMTTVLIIGGIALAITGIVIAKRS